MSPFDVCFAYLFWSVIPRNCDPKLAFPRPTRQSAQSKHRTRIYILFFRNPTPKHLTDDRPTGVVRITQMQPIRQLDRPTLVVYLIHDGFVFRYDTVIGNTRNTFSIPMHWFDVAWSSLQRSKVGGRTIRRPRRGVA
jgi:hypothetical protein